MDHPTPGHPSGHPSGHQFGHGEGTLARGADLVAEARADLTATNARLSDLVGRLRAGWQGRGATSFFALHQAWHDRQSRVVATLDELSTSLGDTERADAATDEQQDAAFARLATRLG
ncbi:WXG100 family type VII secretion target [Nocardioides litoris]|uniref:WXG100 family type VII secretion target n=1 Tax=Nocardioides litoris TaxID=1926648 RepID=UPI00111FCE38|nr:WXG100 family type VII secretion target [Nocardioides litoris]